MSENTYELRIEASASVTDKDGNPVHNEPQPAPAEQPSEKD